MKPPKRSEKEKCLPDEVIKELIWAAHIALDWTKDTRIRIRIAEALDKAETNHD